MLPKIMLATTLLHFFWAYLFIIVFGWGIIGASAAALV